MNLKRPILVLIPIVMAVAITAGYFWGTPRLLSFTPDDQALAVPGGTMMRLTFSRPMNPASVQAHLTITPATEGTYTWQENTLTFHPAKPWSGGQSVQVRLEAGTRAAGWLPLETNQETHWSFTIGQPRLVYLFPINAPANLYVLNPANGEKKALTATNGGISEFTVAAGGDTLFYSVKNAVGGHDLYRLDGLSGDPEMVTFSPVLDCGADDCGSPAVSPKSDYLAFERTQASSSPQPNITRVWFAQLPAREKALPLKATAIGSASAASLPDARLAGPADHGTSQPAWSATGELAYYDSTLKSFVFLDPKTGRSADFPNETGQPGDWTSDGLAFLAPEIFFLHEGNPTLDQVASSHLLRFTLKDGQTQDLTSAENLEDTNPVFSPDGRTVVFARKYLDVERWTPGRQIWLMDASGQNARPLTNDPYYNHYAFAWSPAGDQIAFVRFNQTVPTDPLEIWMVSPITTQAKRLVVAGYSPQWIP